MYRILSKTVIILLVLTQVSYGAPLQQLRSCAAKNNGTDRDLARNIGSATDSVVDARIRRAIIDREAYELIFRKEIGRFVKYTIKAREPFTRYRDPHRSGQGYELQPLDDPQNQNLMAALKEIGIEDPAEVVIGLVPGDYDYTASILLESEGWGGDSIVHAGKRLWMPYDFFRSLVREPNDDKGNLLTAILRHEKEHRDKPGSDIHKEDPNSYRQLRLRVQARRLNILMGDNLNAVLAHNLDDQEVKTRRQTNVREAITDILMTDPEFLPNVIAASEDTTRQPLARDILSKAIDDAVFSASVKQLIQKLRLSLGDRFLPKDEKEVAEKLKFSIRISGEVFAKITAIEPGITKEEELPRGLIFRCSGITAKPIIMNALTEVAKAVTNEGKDYVALVIEDEIIRKEWNKNNPTGNTAVLVCANIKEAQQELSRKAQAEKAQKQIKKFICFTCFTPDFVAIPGDMEVVLLTNDIINCLASIGFGNLPTDWFQLKIRALYEQA